MTEKPWFGSRQEREAFRCAKPRVRVLFLRVQSDRNVKLISVCCPDYEWMKTCHPFHMSSRRAWGQTDLMVSLPEESKRNCPHCRNFKYHKRGSRSEVRVSSLRTLQESYAILTPTLNCCQGNALCDGISNLDRHLLVGRQWSLHDSERTQADGSFSVFFLQLEENQAWSVTREGLFLI